MPPMRTVEQAIQRGEAFIERYYVFKRPLQAKKEGDTWLVVFDVGVLNEQRVQITIDANSGSIIDYEAPKGDV